MRVHVHYVLGQTEGTRKTFLEWTSMDLSSKLSLICGGNINYYKSVPTLTVGIGNTLAIFKTNQQALLSIDCLIIFFLAQTEGERRAFFGVCKKEGSTL